MPTASSSRLWDKADVPISLLTCVIGCMHMDASQDKAPPLGFGKKRLHLAGKVA